MCSIQDQFTGFLASNQLHVGSEIGIKDMDWKPTSGFQVPAYVHEEMKSPMLVGRKAERFLSAYFEQSGTVNLLAENLQVVENKVTLGELDAIISCEGLVFHLELVYKFYLFDPLIEGPEIVKWIGPNRKDCLHTKLQKLREKQFPFLFHPATRKQLTELDVHADEIEQELLFLANCFVPWGFEGNVRFPIDGYWLNRDQFFRSDFVDCEFFIPSKHEWMVRECPTIPWKSHSEIGVELEKCHAIYRSPLVWMKSGSFSFERMFVVWW